MFELCFKKSFNFHEQVQLEIWPLTLVCLYSPSVNRNSSTVWLAGISEDRNAGAAQLKQVTRAHESQYPQPGPKRIFSSPCGRNISVFWQSIKMRLYSSKSFAFHTDIHKVHGAQQIFPRLVYYMCFPNGEFNIFIFACKTVSTSNFVLIFIDSNSIFRVMLFIEA